MECDDIIADETFEDLFHSTTLHIEEKETKFKSMDRSFAYVDVQL